VDTVQVPISFLAKVAQYISASQAHVETLEKTASQRNDELRDKVAHAVGLMVDKGYVATDASTQLVDDLTHYPEKIAEVLSQIVRSAELPTLGSPSGQPDTPALDEVTRFALEGPKMYT